MLEYKNLEPVSVSWKEKFNIGHEPLILMD